LAVFADTFEKQVLLTLIAGMISTNVRKASSRRDDPIFRQSFDVVRLSLSTPCLDTTLSSVGRSTSVYIVAAR
jgi:hypothetical protein